MSQYSSKISHQNSRQIQLLAAELLADSIVKIIPDAQLLQGGSDGVGFYYDILVRMPVVKDIFPALEETIRSVIRSDLPVQHLEMVPAVAEGLFEEKGQGCRAEDCRAIGVQTLQIIKIGSFYDLGHLEGITSTGVLKAFELLDCKDLPSQDLSKGWKIVRISGVAAADRRAIKELVKLNKEVASRHHKKTGQVLNLFRINENSSVTWLPKGLLLQQAIADWSLSLNPVALPIAPLAEEKGAKALVLSAAAAYHAANRSEGEPAVYFTGELIEEGERGSGDCLWDLPLYTHKATIAFAAPEQLRPLLISFLQSVNKTSRLLNVEREVAIALPKNQAKQPASLTFALDAIKTILADQKVSFEMSKGSERQGRALELTFNWKDFAGRIWPGPFLRIEPPSAHKMKEKRVHPITVIFSAVGALERFTALLIEQMEGAFPLFLSPEQVRILPMQSEQMEEAGRLHASLASASIKACVDYRMVDLNTRLLDARRACVPWVVVLGAKELARGVVSLRQLSAGISQEIALSAIAGTLQQEIDISRGANNKYQHCRGSTL